MVEASQLFEAGTESDYDRVLLVVAPEEERIRRWGDRGGDRGGRATPHRRPDPGRGGARERADDVIVNNGTLEDLRQEESQSSVRRWTGNNAIP